MFTSFIGGTAGPWKVTDLRNVTGASLAPVERLAVVQTEKLPTDQAAWCLTGVPSYVRYVLRPERSALLARQEGLGRPGATCAALIPIAKSAAWWEMTQEERREVFEARSRHISESLNYMPAVQRQLYHCRDLGGPFDFLTWFEFAPADATRFEELVNYLRRSDEWRYVEREVDLRLSREP
jgi:hypothetical protein